MSDSPTNIQPERLAEAYLVYYATQDDSYSWAYEEVDRRCKDPQLGLPIVIELINQCRSEAELAFVAAGPVEDLVKRHGSRIIPELQSAAHSTEKVARALGHVWIRESHPAFDDWARLMRELGNWQ